MTEVNFWQPSGAREFRVLAPGEPFFFKTHTVELDFSKPWHRTGPVFGDPRLAPYRLGSS